MLRAWIPSLFIIPIAMAAAAGGCGVGGSSTGAIPDDGDGTYGTGASNGTGAGPNNGKGGSGGSSFVTVDGGVVDPCAEAMLDPGCETVVPDSCGDGKINQD